MKLEFSDEVEKLYEEISPYIVGCGKLADNAPDDIKEKLKNCWQSTHAIDLVLKKIIRI